MLRIVALALAAMQALVNGASASTLHGLDTRQSGSVTMQFFGSGNCANAAGSAHQISASAINQDLGFGEISGSIRTIDVSAGLQGQNLVIVLVRIRHDRFLLQNPLGTIQYPFTISKHAIFSCWILWTMA